MIKKRTVVILGAGASHPYGFPLGRKLFKAICELSRDHPKSLSEMIQVTGYTMDNVREFARVLRNCGLTSVDRLLGRRQEYADIGKVLIAHQISSCEKEESAYRTEND